MRDGFLLRGCFARAPLIMRRFRGRRLGRSGVNWGSVFGPELYCTRPEQLPITSVREARGSVTMIVRRNSHGFRKYVADWSAPIFTDQYNSNYVVNLAASGFSLHRLSSRSTDRTGDFRVECFQSSDSSQTRLEQPTESTPKLTKAAHANSFNGHFFR